MKVPFEVFHKVHPYHESQEKLKLLTEMAYDSVALTAQIQRIVYFDPAEFAQVDFEPSNRFDAESRPTLAASSNLTTFDIQTRLLWSVQSLPLIPSMFPSTTK